MDPENEIHKPLGQDRKRPARPAVRLFGRDRWGIFAITALLLAASVLTALHRDPLLTQQDVDRRMQQVESSAADGAMLATDDGTSRTAVEQMSTARPDKTVSGSGPVIISGSRSANPDTRLAHLPVDDLLEQTEFGRLPVIAADGRRPVDVYARPWSGTRGTRVAIVVCGLGLSQSGTKRALDILPEEVTLAFAASGNSLQRWLQQARRDGHEILLQIPFEPFGYPQNDPGPHTILVEDGPQQNLHDLHWALGRITNYTGIMNFMGGRFLSDPGAIEPVIRDIGERGLLFLDDGTSAQSLTGAMSQQYGVHHAGGDLVVDTELDRDIILKRLDEVERIARREGQAIAVASAFEVSVGAVADWVSEARGRGIEIVGVSALAR